MDHQVVTLKLVSILENYVGMDKLRFLMYKVRLYIISVACGSFSKFKVYGIIKKIVFKITTHQCRHCYVHIYIYIIFKYIYVTIFDKMGQKA